MRTLTLSASVNATLVGGAATAQLGPSYAGEVWLPTVASVHANETTITNEAQCKIYSGALVGLGTYLDGTLSGSTGDSTDRVTGQVLQPGQYIFAVWSGGDSGSTVTLNIQGTRQVP